MQAHPLKGLGRAKQLQPLSPILHNPSRGRPGVKVAPLQIGHVAVASLGVPSGGLGATGLVGTDRQQVRHLLPGGDGVQFGLEVVQVGLGADVPLPPTEEGVHGLLSGCPAGGGGQGRCSCSRHSCTDGRARQGGPRRCCSHRPSTPSVQSWTCRPQRLRRQGQGRGGCGGQIRRRRSSLQPRHVGRQTQHVAP